MNDLDVRCPVCGANKGEPCRNPVTGTTRAIPCVGRTVRR
jgi:hypothetical protein